MRIFLVRNLSIFFAIFYVQQPTLISTRGFGAGTSGTAKTNGDTVGSVEAI
jgi:hypothetical protein